MIIILLYGHSSNNNRPLSTHSKEHAFAHDNKSNDKRPLTPKSMPPTGDKHANSNPRPPTANTPGKENLRISAGKCITL